MRYIVTVLARMLFKRRDTLLLALGVATEGQLSDAMLTDAFHLLFTLAL